MFITHSKRKTEGGERCQHNHYEPKRTVGQGINTACDRQDDNITSQFRIDDIPEMELPKKEMFQGQSLMVLTFQS
jgi:hypothetical protein